VVDRSDVDRLLAANRYLVLATADKDGQPWATPVFFASLDPHTLCWVSSPNSRHSRNIASRPGIAITVFDFTVEVGRSEAAYFDADAAAATPGRSRSGTAGAQPPPTGADATKQRRPAASRGAGGLPSRTAPPASPRAWRQRRVRQCTRHDSRGVTALVHRFSAKGFPYSTHRAVIRHGRPSLILAALNEALLGWLTDDPRFLSAIYATVRPTLAGASVQVSSAGHPLALVRRADGRVQTFGQPGTLLGVLPDPELHDSRTSLRPGDSLVLFTDGVTEARHPVDRDLYGDDRLRDLVVGLADMPATVMADAIQEAVLVFSGGEISDDTVVLILQVP
jgi:hypothetical protein